MSKILEMKQNNVMKILYSINQRNLKSKNKRGKSMVNPNRTRIHEKIKTRRKLRPVDVRCRYMSVAKDETLVQK